MVFLNDLTHKSWSASHDITGDKNKSRQTLKKDIFWSKRPILLRYVSLLIVIPDAICERETPSGI